MATRILPLVGLASTPGTPPHQWRRRSQPPAQEVCAVPMPTWDRAAALALARHRQSKRRLRVRWNLFMTPPCCASPWHRQSGIPRSRRCPTMSKRAFCACSQRAMPPTPAGVKGAMLGLPCTAFIVCGPQRIAHRVRGRRGPIRHAAGPGVPQGPLRVRWRRRPIRQAAGPGVPHGPLRVRWRRRPIRQVPQGPLAPRAPRKVAARAVPQGPLAQQAPRKEAATQGREPILERRRAYIQTRPNAPERREPFQE